MRHGVSRSAISRPRLRVPGSEPHGGRLLDRRAGAPPGLARTGREGLHRRTSRASLPLPAAARPRDRRTRHLRVDRALHGRGARRRQRAARQRGDARLPDDRRARRMGREGGAAGRAGAVRPEDRADRHDGLLFLSRHERAGRRQDLGACLRQRARRRRLSSRRRAQDHGGSRLDARRRSGPSLSARRARRRLRELHHGARPRLERLPLQPHPRRPGDARRRRTPLLQADPRGEPPRPGAGGVRRSARGPADRGGTGRRLERGTLRSRRRPRPRCRRAAQPRQLCHRLPRARGTEGTPNDWDITSSIPRR